MSLPAINGERAGGPWRGGPSPPSHKKKQLRSRDASPAPGASNDDGFPNDGTEDVANNTMGNNGARRDASDFRILVAARIRPFTEREVRQWRLEQRSNAAAAAQDDADEARRARAALRQPFGPAHKSLNATQTGLDGTWRGRLDLDNHDNSGGAGHDAFALDGDEHPPPAVEVESDGRTVVLLDVQHHSPTEAAASAAVRNAFTYDYVYSSFAPNVELDVHLPDAYGHTRGRAHAAPSSSSASASSPYVILDSEDGAARGGTGGGFRHNTAQEQQAEAEQVVIYEQLAVPLVDAALHGYNTCMFAYGQTGSGKTYTMMGTQRHPGLIPRLCQHLFEEVAARNHHIGGGDRRAGASSTSSASPPSAGQNLVMLQLSFMEIYNEQVRDLLKQRPKNAILRYKSRFDTKDVDSDEYRTLKVRHHPTKGIYVEGLTTVAVRTWEECEAFLQQGNALRTQASTAMNAKSSRSHAIFQLQITQRESTGGRVRGKDVALETFSKVNLVDLAGSERNTQSKTTGKHLAEANSINASLSTLRRVLEGLIANRAIATGSPGGGGAGGKAKKSVVIPYRESLLTYVLSDNLGGNSFTVMCANVSPCASSAGETESTLRYATLARGVVNHAKLNEDPTARVMREMRDQLRVMQEALRTAPDPTHVAELEEGIQISETLLREMRSREERYELQLQEQAEKADALRRSAESHKRQEAYWKAEAEKQQRQVEALQAALLAAAAAVTPRAKQTGKTAKGKKSVQRSASPPLQVDDDDGDTRNGSDDEHHSTGNTPTTTPTAKKKKKMKLNVPAVAAAAARRRRSMQSNDSSSSAVGTHGNDRGDASSSNVDDASHDLLSPASREWQPPRTRGTPLSLMGGNSGGGGKGNHKAKPRPSRTSVLPALPGAPSTAPERTRRASRSGSTVATAPSSAAAGGGGGGRRNQHRPSKVGAAPRPPLAKPTARRRRGSVAGRPSGKPVIASREGELHSVADQNDVADDDDDDDRHDAVGELVDNDERDVEVKSAAGNGYSGHAVPRAPPAHLAEAAEEPSFYQTEQFLSQAAAAEAEVESAAQTTEESFAMDHVDVTTTHKAAVVATLEDAGERHDKSLSHHHHHLSLGKTPESREALPMQVELADALRKRNGKGKHRQHDVKDSAVGGPVVSPGKATSSPHAAEEATTDTFSAGHDDDGAAEREEEEEEDRDSMHGRHALDESGAGSDFAPPFPRRGSEVRVEEEEEEEQAASPAEYVEDFIADDTDTPAASFDRSGKLRDVAAAAAAAVAVAASSGDGDGGATKKKKKHKSTKGKGKSQRDGSPGVEDEEDVRRSRHYSTIDTLLY